MNRSSKSLLLEEEIGLLVRHFGLRRVRAAIAKLSGDDEELLSRRKITRSNSSRPTQPSINHALELIRDHDPQRYRLLSEFLARLRDRKTLPESEDIRHFAQLVGLKEIQGKSRKDMIPTLMRFLLDRDIDTLQADIASADTISQQQRQQGFSVLTDKLLGERR